MILLLQIVLTIFAFKRGWRWKSLLPIALGFLVAFIIGMFFAIFSIDENWILFVATIIDSSIIIVLLVMIFNPVKNG